MSNKQKKYSVEIHDDAAQMLHTHIKFLANVSVSAAKKLKKSLNEALKSLVTMPHRCPTFQTYKTRHTYRRLIVGRYQIIFSINESDNIVRVYYIIDSRQDNDL